MSAINLINSGSYGVTGGYSSVDAVKAAADEKKTEGKVESASTSKTPDVDTYEKTQKRLSSTQLKQIQDQQMASFTRMLAAQQAISEDGEWGVNAVATRIVDMCVSLSGGDSSKLSEMRAAVEKGFEQAGAQWGTSLPSICQDTHDEINKRFDYWEQNGSVDGYVYAAAGK